MIIGTSHGRNKKIKIDGDSFHYSWLSFQFLRKTMFSQYTIAPFACRHFATCYTGQFSHNNHFSTQSSRCQHINKRNDDTWTSWFYYCWLMNFEKEKPRRRDSNIWTRNSLSLTCMSRQQLNFIVKEDLTCFRCRIT